VRDNDEAPKFVVDVVSLTLLLGYMGDLLPPIATVLTIIWTALRIAETETIRRVWRWWRGRA